MDSFGVSRTADSPARQSSLNTTRAQRDGGSSTGKLLDFVNQEEKLQCCIHQLNSQGIFLLQQGNYAQALQFFQQCEATLEYAASCGRTLDRNLILTVLNNEAVAHQRGQNYEKACSYVEAIIYNLNLFLESNENKLLQAQIVSKIDSNCLNKVELESMVVYVMRKYEAAMYLLQFAGLQSQCLSHEDSLENAQKVIQMIHQIAKLILMLEKRMKQENSSILEDLISFPISINQLQYKELQIEFQRISKEQDQNPKLIVSQQSHEVSHLLDRTNLVEIFLLKPKYLQSSQQKTIPFTDQFYIQLVFLAVGAYFTLSVEWEQLNQERSSIYFLGPSNQGHQGECYRLMALIFAFKHLPHTNPFRQQILKTYHHTYKHSSSQRSMGQHFNLNQLAQKYSNYLMQKDISISLEQSQEKGGLKRQSKKLNELLRQDPIPPPKVGQQNYLAELPSIDSIQITNSLTNHNKTHSSNSDLAQNRTPPIIHPKNKSSTSIYHHKEPKVTLHKSTNPTDNLHKANMHKKSKKCKSKSKSHKSQSKEKLKSTKKMKKNTFIVVIGLNSTTKRSNSKDSKNLKLKGSNEKGLRAMIKSAGMQQRFAPNYTRKVKDSETFKSVKTVQFGSQKNFEPIRMNRVKGVDKMIGSATYLQDLRSPSKNFQMSQRHFLGISKGKSKSNQSKSNSSKTKLKNAFMKSSTSKEKIYTSIKQTVRR